MRKLKKFKLKSKAKDTLILIFGGIGGVIAVCFYFLMFIGGIGVLFIDNTEAGTPFLYYWGSIGIWVYPITAVVVLIRYIIVNLEEVE